MCGYMLLTKISRPTGAVGSSFDSEVIAAIEGFHDTLADPPPEGALIRWFTDSLSAPEALQALLTTFSDLIRQMSDVLEQLMLRNIFIAAVWIPSHCGIQLNEEADKLANKGLRSFSLITKMSHCHCNRPLVSIAIVQKETSSSSKTCQFSNILTTSRGALTPNYERLFRVFWRLSWSKRLYPRGHFVRSVVGA